MKKTSRLALLVLAAGVAALGWTLLPAEVGSSAPVAAAPAAGAADPWTVPEEPARATLFYDRFETFTTRDGLPSDKTTAVLPAGEDLWVGTDRGLALRRDGAWSSWNRGDGLAHDYVTSLALDPVSGDLWVSTLGGLSVFSGGVFRTYTQLDSGLMNDVVYQVAVRDRTVWAATAAGASRLDLTTGSWQLFDHENSIMHEPWCYSLTHGPGRVWIGIWGAGVVELDDATGLWREYRDPDKEMEIDLLRDDGPIHDVTSWVAWESGLLWQATYFGLSRYDGRRWRTFRRDDTGIPGDFINHVAARGRVAFLGTDEGFGVLDGETAVSYRRTDSGRAEVLVHREGVEVERRLLDTAPGDNYILWTAPGDGEVWLATGRGLSRGWAAGEKQP
jgi:ligand-binding sensor domain-containing protein